MLASTQICLFGHINQLFMLSRNNK